MLFFYPTRLINRRKYIKRYAAMCILGVSTTGAVADTLILQDGGRLENGIVSVINTAHVVFKLSGAEGELVLERRLVRVIEFGANSVQIPITNAANNMVGPSQVAPAPVISASTQSASGGLAIFPEMGKVLDAADGKIRARNREMQLTYEFGFSHSKGDFIRSSTPQAGISVSLGLARALSLEVSSAITHTSRSYSTDALSSTTNQPLTPPNNMDGRVVFTGLTYQVLPGGRQRSSLSINGGLSIDQSNQSSQSGSTRNYMANFGLSGAVRSDGISAYWSVQHAIPFNAPPNSAKAGQRTNFGLGTSLLVNEKTALSTGFNWAYTQHGRTQNGGVEVASHDLSLALGGSYSLSKDWLIRPSLGIGLMGATNATIGLQSIRSNLAF